MNKSFITSGLGPLGRSDMFSCSGTQMVVGSSLTFYMYKSLVTRLNPVSGIFDKILKDQHRPA